MDRVDPSCGSTANATPAAERVESGRLTRHGIARLTREVSAALLSRQQSKGKSTHQQNGSEGADDDESRFAQWRHLRTRSKAESGFASVVIGYRNEWLRPGEHDNTDDGDEDIQSHIRTVLGICAGYAPFFVAH